MNTNDTPIVTANFVEFPKMARLSREVIVTDAKDLTSKPFAPYSANGNNAYVLGVSENGNTPSPGAKTKVLFTCVQVFALGEEQQRGSEQVRKRLPRQKVRPRGQVEGRRPKSSCSQKMDDRYQVKTVPRLRRIFSYMLYGLRSPQRHCKGLQHWQHVCSPLQSRTYPDRVK